MFNIDFEQQQINEHYDALCKNFNLLPIKVTAFYRAKINEEVLTLGHRSGPLHRIAYPTKEKITRRVSGEVSDFVEDRNNMSKTENFIIQKYKDRLLFLPTLEYFGHCQYCFRQDVLEEQKKMDHKSLLSQLAVAIEYVQDHPEIEEIILSGGDPIMLLVRQMRQIIESILGKTNVKYIRIHSRVLAYSPETMSNDMMDILSEAKIRFVSHFSHPYEICSVVANKLEKMNKYNGIKLYNQFPLLRNINDNAILLVKHLKLLDDLNVRNLSIFIPDPINYSASYRIPISRLRKLTNDINWNSPSWVNSTRFVMDTKYGKVRLDNIESYDEERQVAIFRRGNSTIEYPDFPEDLDKPGDIKTMLWKEYADYSSLNIQQE
ncbi:MAG: 4Fe-4S cluster-binding domain-containing protein [Rickettsiales bacterium]|jgi:lysine 2,3-aminomutase|nr:4Fe-4S cluster-binding domain-containing protein [Rickettsiales bacterium]